MNKTSLQKFIQEQVKRALQEENNVSSMKFWHGGNLDQQSLDNDFVQKGGRYEYGPGLYLTTHYDTAAKYAKGGSRKLYIVEVSSGVELGDVTISLEDALEAVKQFASAKHRSEISERIESRSGGSGTIKASVVLNMLVNIEGALRPNKTGALRQWLIDIGADYHTVSSPFGYGETMLVLYNMKKIKSVKPATKADGYDDFH